MSVLLHREATSRARARRRPRRLTRRCAGAASSSMPPAARVSTQTNDQRLAAKYGRSLAWARQLHDEMTERGAAAGVTFDFTRVQPTNSFDAHRLTHLAAASGAADRRRNACFARTSPRAGRLATRRCWRTRIGNWAGWSTRCANFSPGIPTARTCARHRGGACARGYRGAVLRAERPSAVRGAQPIETFVAALRRVSREP